MRDRLSDDRWRALSPHLDQALDLTVEQRWAWLASLRAADTRLADDLEVLLAQHEQLSQAGFMEGAPPPAPVEGSLAGHTVGAYRLRSLIGQGGMGSVWLADRCDDRFVGVAAVKLLNASLVGREGEARFRREGSILARLRHPHIAHLIDAGLTPLGHPYLVLEHVAGERIDRYCDERALGIESRVRLFLDVLAAVAHAHANLVVHRDLKPSNVLVTADGRVKLLDFGIAKLLHDETGPAEAFVTRTGEAALTPEYAAPEQLTGGDVTTATDVYALGVLLYVLLSGRHPAGAGTTSPVELIRAIVDTEPPRVSEAVTLPAAAAADSAVETAARRATSPRKLRGLLRGDLDNIVAKALKKRAAERYASVEAMADDLRRHLNHEPVGARADSLAYRAGRFVRRNRMAVALSTLAVTALAGGLVGTIVQARRAQRHAAAAEAQRRRADQEARATREQRDFALRQLARAEAINDLMTFVMSDAAPLGRPFTAGELLQRAERVVARRRDGAVDDRVYLLVAIGGEYQVHDEHDRARKVLAEAYELARGSAEPATRAEAACALASAVSLAGEAERAEQLIAEAERELPHEPQFALHRVSCKMRGSEVAQERGDARVGVERAEAAQRILDESGFAPAMTRLWVTERLADSYRIAGRYREAATLFDAAFAQLVALGRDETEGAGALLNNWGVTLWSLGQPAASERLLRRAVDLGRSDRTQQTVPPMRLNNLARTLRDLGRLPEARQYAEQAYRKGRATGQQIVVNQSLTLRAAIYSEQGDLTRAEATLAEVEPRLQRMLPENHVAFAVVAELRAEIAEARGDAAAAFEAADHAVAIAEASTQRSGYLERMLLCRSEVALRFGRVEQAAADAEAAVRLYRENTPPGALSAYLGHASLALGRALQAQGRPAAARAAFTSAAAHLEGAVGAQHPDTATARRLASAVTPQGAAR